MTVVKTQPVDVVLMDIRMPVMDGTEATRQITELGGDTKVLVLTTFDLDEYVFAALRNGASGFLLKDALPDDLLGAIRTVARGWRGGRTDGNPPSARPCRTEAAGRQAPRRLPPHRPDRPGTRGADGGGARRQQRRDRIPPLHGRGAPSKPTSAGCWQNSRRATASAWC